MEVTGRKLRILITGGNGFVGSHVLESLVKKGNCEVGITLRTTSDTWRVNSMFTDDIERFFIDREGVETVISRFKPDLVLHLAVLYKKRHTASDIEEMFNSNITFPSKILQAMVQNGVRFFINTGTFTEYSIQNRDLTVDASILPSNLYSATKIAFEDILKFYTKTYNINAITLKLTSPYGPRDNTSKLIPYLMNCATSKKVANLSPGDQMWDYIYVKDVAEAYKSAIEYIVNSRESYDSFLIGSGESHSLKEIADIIKSFNGEFEINWSAVPYSEVETYYIRADITKARNTLKWWPKYTPIEGLRETYEYYRSAKKNDGEEGN